MTNICTTAILLLLMVTHHVTSVTFVSYLMDTPNLRTYEVFWEVVQPLSKTSNCGVYCL